MSSEEVKKLLKKWCV